MNEIRFFECPSCGARITSDKKFCDYCGGQLKLPEEKKQSPVAPDTQFREETVSQAYSKPVDVVQAQKTTSGLAVKSFVLCLFGFVPIALATTSRLTLASVASFFIYPIVLILGITASVTISRPNSNLTGRGFAIAAIIISIIQIIVIIGIITGANSYNYYY
jgi:hypothetical protein